MINTSKARVLKHGDVVSHTGEKQWFYTDIVKDHFFNPRNIFKNKKEAEEYKEDGVGLVGSPACGDGMRMFIQIDKKTEKIKDIKFETYGCGTAIASTSAFSVMLIQNGGMTIEEALKVGPKDIANFLGGLPARKFHCSVLADKAFREAVNDYFRRTNQHHRVKDPGKKIIDNILKITDQDIEHAVLDGAKTFEDVQKKTKVGIHDKSCIPEVERLIEFYTKKYYGE